MSGFNFGPYPCKWSECFYLTKHSIGVVNQKPIVPGHCLVLSRRVTPRFGDLSAEEVSDLWHTAQAISTPLEHYFKSHALTFAMQDGENAGQTVPHVHIHVIPRVGGDFVPNDKIYDELEGGIKVDAEKERKPRTEDEMAEEAMRLRNLFQSPLQIPQDDHS